MSYLSRRAAAICAIATMAVAVLAAAAGGRPTSRCEAAFLRAHVSVVHGSASAGHIEYRLSVSNHGPSVCIVHEHPALQLIGAGGERLPIRVRDEGHGGLAVIHLGQTVSAKLRLSPDIPGPGEPSHGPCERPAHHMHITLSQSITVVAPIEPPTSVCEHGTIAEEPLT
jgi:hypothetical protein